MVQFYSHLYKIQCLDINECKARTSGCDLNADCHNNPGGLECECFIGFQGDGTNCFDIDECIVNTDECGDHSTCLNTVGLDLIGLIPVLSGYFLTVKILEKDHICANAMKGFTKQRIRDMWTHVLTLMSVTGAHSIMSQQFIIVTKMLIAST